MTLIKFNHHRPVSRYHDPVFDRFTSMIDRIMQADSDYSPVICPAANVIEKEDSYVLEMALPGYSKSDIQIELEKNELQVSGNREQEKENGYTRREFGYGAFSRKFYLPNSVVSDKIEASFREGLLNIVIPKHESAIPRPPRRIDID